MLVVWKLDRLGRDLRHLINTVHDLTTQGIGLKVQPGHGAGLGTTTAAGKPVFGIFAALAEFERELIAERTRAGLAAARARGRKGGAPFKMTPAKLQLAMQRWASQKPRSAPCARNWGSRGKRSIAMPFSINVISCVSVWMRLLQPTSENDSVFAGFLAVFAEFERALIRSRIKAGITDARKRGKAHGRPRAKANDAAQIRTLAQQGLSQAAIARHLGL